MKDSHAFSETRRRSKKMISASSSTVSVRSDTNTNCPDRVPSSRIGRMPAASRIARIRNCVGIPEQSRISTQVGHVRRGGDGGEAGGT